MSLSMIFECTALLLLFILGGFFIRIIKKENENYLKKSHLKIFKQFKLYIPQWWEETLSLENDQICFKKLNCDQPWEARFFWHNTPNQKNLTELIKSIALEKKIYFDPETCIVYDPEDFKKKKLISSGEFEMTRIEGSATNQEQKSLYYDAFLIREKKSGCFLYAESKSSILNGLIEGLYFEAVLSKLEIIKINQTVTSLH